MKQLVIAEKPSVGRDIARVLSCKKTLNGAIEGEKYIVTWGLGHLVTLADPEGYNKEYKDWNIEALPLIPDHFKYEVIKKTNKQYQVVKNLIHRNDVSNIIIATDAGREGELVARLILLKAGNKKPLKRLWISSVTDRAIQEGFKNLKDGSCYQNLYEAALSRAEADWIVGINATRALTCKYNAQLSCGRVQTPTIAMIQKREEEIRSFVAENYYGAKLNVRSEGNAIFSLTWQDKKGNTRSFQKNKIENVVQQGKKIPQAKVISVLSKDKKEYAPLLYDLTELQRDANRLYNYTAKQTLNICQNLYEHHKVLTYPRTDSRYLSDDIVATLKDRLRAVNTGEYKKYVATLFRQEYGKKAFYINNQKVTDHHAIIPTEEMANYAKMSSDERRIYDLVVKRFLSVLMPAYEYTQTSVVAQLGEEQYVAKGKVTKAEGFKVIYQKDSFEEIDSKEIKHQELPMLKVGDMLHVESIQITSGKTTPPSRFTEATLLSAMENPVKYMESKESSMVQVLGQTGGLGTVATRADIIEKLFATFLIERNGKEIVITAKGKQLLSLVPEDLKKPELTADWELKLQKIAQGNLSRAKFMKEMREYSRAVVNEIKDSEGIFRHENLTNHKCPECGKRLLLVKGKNSTMHVCQDRACGYRETISRTSNARCPVCHKKMELRGKGEAQLFTCGCGYKEKLSKFTERRKKEGAGVSKKDINRYLSQQKKEDAPINTAFADAFAKLNIK